MASSDLFGGVSRRGILAGLLSGVAVAATAKPLRLARSLAAPIVTLSPGVAWDGTLTDASPPSPTARVTAKPWNVELFQNWDTITGATTIGFDAGAGGLSPKGVDHVTFYCHGNTIDVASPTWNTWVDPNGSSWQEYGYFVTLDGAGAYARGTALGQTKPQFSIWAQAFPNDPTMQPQLIGPFTFNPRSSRFDGTVTLAPTGADANSFQAAIALKSSNSYERVNIVCTQQGAVKLNTATTGSQLSILTTGVYGVTFTAAQTADFVGSVATALSTLTGSIAGDTLSVSAISGAPLVAGASLSATLAANPTFPKGVRILQQLTGSAGSTGTYQINKTPAAAASGTITAALCTLSVSVKNSGTIAAGNTLVTAGTLPNIVIQPYGTGGTTGIGGVGTYILTAFAPDDALPVGGYTLASRSMTTTVTVTMGDATQSNWTPAFDGIRLEGAGIKVDLVQMGTSTALPYALQVDNNGYGAFCLCGTDSFVGVPTGTTGATGSGAAMLMFGGTPPGWRRTALNPKTPGSAVPGGNAESQLDWFTVMGSYHHDSFLGWVQPRLVKHATFARLPQPFITNQRCSHDVTIHDTSAVAANLRTYIDAFMVVPPGGATSPTFARSGLNGSGGAVTLTQSGGPTYTYTLVTGGASVTTLTTIYNWINGSVAGDGGVFVSGWSATGFVDTTGRAATHMTLSTLTPSAAIPATAVPGGGLPIQTVIDVHNDILAWTLPTSLVPIIDNRVARFVVAWGTVEGAPMLINGSGSSIQDVGVVNCLFQDTTNQVVGGGNQTPTSIAGACRHFVIDRISVIDVSGAFSVNAPYNPDVYCELAQSYFENMSYSVASKYTASFDGSNVMTVTATSTTASFTASISGATMNVSAMFAGTLSVGLEVTGSGVAAGTIITAIAAGGGAGNYTVSGSQSVGSEAMAANAKRVLQGDVLQGTLAVVQSFGSGGTTGDGGVGTYLLSMTVASSAAAARNVSGNANLSPSRNCYRTGSTPYGSDGLSKNFGNGQSDLTLFQNPANDDRDIKNYAPIAAGPLQLTDLTYAGAVLPDGSWNLAA